MTQLTLPLESTMFESKIRVAIGTALLAVTVGTTGLAAQSAGDELRSEFPELGTLFDAFDVTQAALFERVVEIGMSSEADAGEEQLRSTLDMMNDMTMDHMMQMGGMADMHANMAMAGPFGELETRAKADLTQLIRGTHSASDAASSLSNVEPLTPRAIAVLERGREFEARLFDIYADAGISDKSRAVNEAIDDYLGDQQNAVPSSAKIPSLMLGHPYAGAFATGYPELSGLHWAGQWLQLASLEPLMLGGDDVESGVGTTIERFNGKVTGMQGMSMLPTEMPMVPAISPLLYSRHPEASAIIDNLNMLETVIADVLVHPDVRDRQGSIDAAVTEFTNATTNLATDRDYLLSALRGGIYNQGGPALGELARSERNRSRMEMEMGPHLMMPGMN